MLSADLGLVVLESMGLIDHQDFPVDRLQHRAVHCDKLV